MEDYTFKEVADLWEADKKQYIKPASYSTYILLLHKHLLPAFGDRVSISENEVQDFVLRKLSEGLSVGSVREMVTVLKMVVRFGAKNVGMASPDWTIRFPTEQVPTRPDVLTKREYRQLLNHTLQHYSNRNLGICLSLTCGLRIGEVCALQWRDLDLQEGTIRIRKTLERIYLPEGSHLVLGKPKTQSAVRDVPLPAELVRILRPLARRADPDEFILSNGKEPIEPKTYRDYYKKLLKDLGMRPIKYHGLRHSFATRCIESGCDYKTVSVLLGHATVSTTMDLYVHPDLNQKKKVIEKATREYL